MGPARTSIAFYAVVLGVFASATVNGCGGDQFTSDETGAGGSAGGAASGGTAGGGGNGATGGGTGGTSAGGGAGTGGSEACNGVCVPRADGWGGPVMIIDNASHSVDPCSDPYATEKFLAHDAQTVTPATCSCACKTGAAVQCGPAQLELFASSGCSQPSCGTAVLTKGLCIQAPAGSCGSGPGGARVTATATGACTSTVVKNIPQPWKRSVRGCEPSFSSKCGSGGLDICLPPASGAICVYKQGAQTCPPEYPKLNSLQELKQDTRDCTAKCQCSGPSCGKVTAFDQQACGGTPTGEYTVPKDCDNALVDVQSVKFDAVPFCNPTTTEVTPLGDAQEQPITICCQ